MGLFFKAKNEVFDKFKEFKSFVEKQSGKYIQILRTDNGKEYANKDFDNYCKNNGIKREHTVPYTPQQNGVAERKNMTLMEMARCMLHARNMDPKFWVEAINTTIGHLQLLSNIRLLNKHRVGENQL